MLMEYYSLYIVIGVGSNLIDAHNNARYHLEAQQNLYLGINEIWCPP